MDLFLNIHSCHKQNTTLNLHLLLCHPICFQRDAKRQNRIQGGSQKSLHWPFSINGILKQRVQKFVKKFSKFRSAYIVQEGRKAHWTFPLQKQMDSNINRREG